MTDKEEFEDPKVVDLYVAALPEPDAAYRSTLRNRLASAPATPSRRLVPLRWRWTAVTSVVVAAAIAIALLVVPLGPHHQTPLSPQSVLARAVEATTNITPFRLTSEISFVSLEDGAPAAVAHDLGTNRMVMQSAVRDATHWRFDIRTLQPALESGNQVIVANGSSIVWYKSLTNRAVRYSRPDPRMGAALLGMLEGGLFVPLGQTLEQYLQELNDPKTGKHARFVGQETVLGRITDVVEVWPVYSTASGSCSSAAQCLKQSKGYGRARIYVDHEHGLVLRYEQFDIPAHQSDVNQNLVYQVRSVTFGAAPSQNELSYRPPVPAPDVSSASGPGVTSSNFGSNGPVATWHAPKGFISLAAPTASSGESYVVVTTGSGQDPTFGGGSATAVFRLGGLPVGSTEASRGPFLLVQEQIRTGGLPSSLTGGSAQSAGSCLVHTGTYSDGLHWLAYSKGHVSLLAVADSLSETALVHWASTEVCH